ncbi:glycosyltransferase family 4 protein [Xanthomonas euvesicatoria]|uniref:glycosyltransferase family 4 protein n=1 Tax=Xanthomonas euvesicatoria TaxID=456327 RepID=UPI0004A4FFD2|nr:glycosyltransferase family 4 protein [Xanthomonas euvesicatoria]QTK46972.1 glycosyltransferase family 4 protein [Xanthomonas euvesicatoria pv. alfalfae]
MRIAICSSFVPFINGGARFIVEWLGTRLREHGHDVEIVYLPMWEEPDSILPQMASCRLMDLSHSVDRIIITRPPAHLIQHPNKVVWFIHHFRLFYDLWDSPYRAFPDDERHRSLRNAIVRADTTALNEARRVFANSQVVADRLKRYNNVSAEVLYPPLHDVSKFHDAGQGDEIVCVCRIEPHKRQHLLVEAFRYVRTPVKLRLCGIGNLDYVNQLHAAILENGLAERVVLVNRWISEEEKISWLSTALASAYLPKDEDSYGYPSLETASAGKPILTTTDSGGVVEFVEDGRSGFIAEPDPRALAEAIDRLWTDRGHASRMGLGARERVRELRIDWSHVIERVLS